jgi:hypothetical protein
MGDCLGAFFMVACIICISVGGALSSGSGEIKENGNLYLFLAVFFALLVGLTFAINSVNIFWIINLGLNID